MAAIDDLFAAYRALQAEGWQDMIYVPKDGTRIQTIELGSTGVHPAAWCSYGHKPLDTCGCFFAEDGGDLWPTHPILWKPIS